ncbi:MAG TPA: HAD hydrolase family protein [Actinomycetota bacterium]|nr:HAD hydrolase family protein [Actinomycetota bacterium]
MRVSTPMEGVKRLPHGRPNVPALRCVYADLDGTLLGPGGSLFAGPEGGVTGRAAEAVRRLHEAGVRLVLMSGRTRRGIAEVARVLGAGAYIAELGALIVEREGASETVIRNTGPDAVSLGTIVRSGAGAFLLERFPRSLRPVAPWSEVTLMLEGWVEPAEANAALRAAGYGWLELHDNGRMRRKVPGLDVEEVHALHLLPKGVDKASAVALDRERHGIALASAVAVGDSRSDLRVAGEVAAFFLVANGLPSLRGESLPDNVWVTDAQHGDGFAEAIDAALAQ